MRLSLYMSLSPGCEPLQLGPGMENWLGELWFKFTAGTERRESLFRWLCTILVQLKVLAREPVRDRLT